MNFSEQLISTLSSRLTIALDHLCADSMHRRHPNVVPIMAIQQEFEAHVRELEAEVARLRAEIEELKAELAMSMPRGVLFT